MSGLDFLAEVSTEFSFTPLFVGAGSSDLFLEAQHNEHALSLTAAQAQSLTVEDLRQMIYHIIAAKREQLQHIRGSSYAMQFYCWHDEQAGQLRFSLIAAAAMLPFGCRVQLVAEVADILQPFLTSSYLDGISWSELEEATPSFEADEYLLKVWQTVL
ncbi:hypothetical protein [Hymenobacter lucidus]|uniref:Uncharacterized protein n=1 Tax=Hymenobacter lucidus TaxID=2880930 RepID=A0ABS8AS69_9BACT|nr:hypothetical protein [Hymenobacter lucidus]MCB2408626.1 hypothetical protein [Hymenobacter lucidus]